MSVPPVIKISFIPIIIMLISRVDTFGEVFESASQCNCGTNGNRVFYNLILHSYNFPLRRVLLRGEQRTPGVHQEHFGAFTNEMRVHFVHEQPETESHKSRTKKHHKLSAIKS